MVGSMGHGVYVMAVIVAIIIVGVIASNRQGCVRNGILGISSTNDTLRGAPRYDLGRILQVYVVGAI